MRWARRAYADGPFGQVHYQVMGEGPTVLLFHQAPQTSAQFDNVYAPLASHGFRVVGIDMPGFGMSDPTPDTPYVEDYAEVGPAVLDALGVKRAGIIGHHTGGLVATEFANRWPERTAALVIHGPLPVTEEERQDFMENGHKRELALKALPGGEHLANMFKTRERMANGTVPLERITGYVVQAMSGRGQYWHGHHAAYQYHHDTALMGVTVPTLIITNTGDIIYDLAQRARAIRPDLAYVELEGGGVDIVDQQPEAWSAEVAAFLKSHMAGAD